MADESTSDEQDPIGPTKKMSLGTLMWPAFDAFPFSTEDIGIGGETAVSALEMTHCQPQKRSDCNHHCG